MLVEGTLETLQSVPNLSSRFHWVYISAHPSLALLLPLLAVSLVATSRVNLTIQKHFHGRKQRQSFCYIVSKRTFRGAACERSATAPRWEDGDT